MTHVLGNTLKVSIAPQLPRPHVHFLGGLQTCVGLGPRTPGTKAHQLRP